MNEGTKKGLSECSKIKEECEREDKKMLIIGDLNARTGAHQAGKATRISEDKVLNTEGKKLIKWCEDNGMEIGNGATEGDEKGKITCFAAIGGSVIDYVIKNKDENIINYMEILFNDESDHFPIKIRLKVQKEMERKKTRGKGKQKSLKWTKGAAVRYGEMLEEMWTKDREGTKRGELENWQNIKETVWEAADKAKMVKVKREGGTENSWYNGECKKQKSEVKTALATYRENKESEAHREKWREARKKYREACREAKKEWQEERWKEVEECKDAAEFWRAIGKFRKRREVTNNSIKDEEWIRHFYKLLGEELKEKGEKKQERRRGKGKARQRRKMMRGIKKS